MNASYHDRRGLVIKRWPKTITIANPGGFRIPIEEAILGGNSDPRNETLLKMFNLVGIGERAGSGIPSIYHVWAEQKWEAPSYQESFGPDRTTLTLQLCSFSTDLQENLTAKFMEVIQFIDENPYITAAEIADRLRTTGNAISQRIRALKQKGILTNIGPDKGGYWKIDLD